MKKEEREFFKKWDNEICAMANIIIIGTKRVEKKKQPRINAVLRMMK
jgi:hypothetical protein